MNQSVWINRLCSAALWLKIAGLFCILRLNFASSIRISDNTVMTTSRDVLETLGTDKQPSDVLVALGYASWEKGQLEQEILDNAWLTAPADLNILFKTPIADRWREAAKLIGVDILTMPGVAGHA